MLVTRTILGMSFAAFESLLQAVLAAALTFCACTDGYLLPTQKQVFNVRDFGAKGDGSTMDTNAVRMAFEASRKLYRLCL